MRVQVHYFAVLRESKGVSMESVEVESGTTMSGLFGILFGSTALAELPVLYAIDEVYVQGDTPVSDGAAVCFLPPLGGG